MGPLFSGKKKAEAEMQQGSFSQSPESKIVNLTKNL